MAKIDEDEFDHLTNNFDTTTLLRAVKELDKARVYLRDGDYCAPPELRDDLQKLHGFAMDVINNGYMDKTQDMFDLAGDIEAEVSQLMEHLEFILETVQNLNSLYPESLADSDEKE